MESEVMTEDKCQCCLIDFAVSQELENAVTSELQSIFFDFLRIKVDNFNLKTKVLYFFILAQRRQNLLFMLFKSKCFQ